MGISAVHRELTFKLLLLYIKKEKANIVWAPGEDVRRNTRHMLQGPQTALHLEQCCGNGCYLSSCLSHIQ